MQILVAPVGAERVTRPLSALTLDAPSLQHATPTRAFGDRTLPVASPPLGQGALGQPLPRGMRFRVPALIYSPTKGPPAYHQRGPYGFAGAYRSVMVTVASSPVSLPVSVQPAQTSAIFTCPMCGRGFRLKRKARTARPLCSGRCRALASRERRGNKQAQLSHRETPSPHAA